MLNNSECIHWSGHTRSDGYGVKYVYGREMRAHRWVYESANGPIPSGMFVMHLCDNPPCVNIAHLRLGTHADNMRDMREKGRHPGSPGDRNGMRTHPERHPHVSGESHGRHVLTWGGVAEIRDAHASGESTASLARRFGVGYATAQKVVTGKTWKTPAANHKEW